jgi:hypothetical protein
MICLFKQKYVAPPPRTQAVRLANISEQVDSLRELQDSQDTKLRYIADEI